SGPRRGFFRLRVFARNPKQVVVFTDLSVHMRFKALEVSSMKIDPDTGQATVEGAGVNLNVPKAKRKKIGYVLSALDSPKGDALSIKLDNGYSRSGKLLTGSITIR